MNYLAHLFLADTLSKRDELMHDEKILLGNYLGDFIKGKIDSVTFNTLVSDEQVKTGIVMHRKIDLLADQHIQSLLNNNTITFQQRRYAGITFDLACDHFLARDWGRFSEQSLENFSGYCINSLQKQHAFMPEKARVTFNYLTRYQWLTHYQDMNYIEQVFLGIQRRLKKDNNIDQAFKDFQNNYESLDILCTQFINDLLTKNFKYS